MGGSADLPYLLGGYPLPKSMCDHAEHVTGFVGRISIALPANWRGSLQCGCWRDIKSQIQHKRKCRSVGTYLGLQLPGICLQIIVGLLELLFPGT